MLAVTQIVLNSPVCVTSPHLQQIRAAEQALTGKVQASKQWQQMKQLMQQKSQEVVELRKKLATYEPEDVASEDAGAVPARP